MLRIVIKISALFVGLIILSGILLGMTLRTGPGQSLLNSIVRPQIEKAVAESLGSEISYDRLRGALPGEIIVDNIQLTDNNQPWAKIEKVSVHWSPMAFVRGNIYIDDITITQADLLAMPPDMPEQAPEDPKVKSNLDLPPITLKQFTIDDFSIDESVLGTAYDIKASGGLIMKAGAGQANIELESAQKSDAISLVYRYDGTIAALNASIFSAQSGLLTQIADAKDPIDISLVGEGPVSAFASTIKGRIGAYGNIDMQVMADLKAFTNASLEGEIQLGKKLPPEARQIAGGTIRLRINMQNTADSMRVDIQELNTALGDFKGSIIGPALLGNQYDLQFSGSLEQEILTLFGAEALTGPLDITTNVDNLNTDNISATINSTITTALGTTNLQNLTLNKDGSLALDIRAILSDPRKATPMIPEWLGKSPTITAHMEKSAGNELKIEALQITTPDNASTTPLLVGGAQVNLSDLTFNADFKASLAQSTLRSLTGIETFQDGTILDITVTGTPSNARLKLKGIIPPLALDNITTAPGSFSAAFSGLPAAPSGTFSILAEDESYRGRFEILNDNNVLTIPNIAFSSSGLSVDGNAMMAINTGELDISLAIDAPKEVTLFTGQILRGKVQVNASQQSRGGPLSIDAATSGLRLDTMQIGQSQINAQGPLSALNVAIQSNSIDLDTVYLTQLTSLATLDLSGDETIIDLKKFNAALDSSDPNQTIVLQSPTQIRLGENITLAKTKLKWLGDGALTVSAKILPDNYNISVDGTDLSLPDGDMRATLSLYLDTAEAQPGSFSMTAQKQDQDGNILGVLAANGEWDGRTITTKAKFSNLDDGEFANLNAAIPAQMSRALGQIRFDLPDKPLSGAIQIDGPVEGILAFLPDIPLSVRGTAKGLITLGGTLNDPSAVGKLSLTQGRIEDEVIGFAMDNVMTEADFTHKTGITRANLTMTAADASGKAEAITLNATIENDLTKDKSAVEGHLTLNKAKLIDSPELEFVSAAKLDLTGTIKRLTLAGDINIETIDAQIPDLAGSADTMREYTPITIVRTDKKIYAPVSSGPEVPSLELLLDLTIKADNRIFIRGRGLDSEWKTDLKIQGTAAAPEIDGNISIREGTFNFAGRSFDITKGTISFTKDDPTNPNLDIQASFDADNVTAVMGVTGTAQSPRIGLSSSPSRPQEDVLALILFGKPPTELSAIESLQIAGALAQLTGANPFGGSGGGLTNGLRSGIGLDALSFGIDPATGKANVEVGKYISDDLYVSARQAAGESGTEITVTYEALNNITIQSTLKPNGTQNVSANYKRDY